MITKTSYYGNPFVGLYVYSDNNFTFVPVNFQDKHFKDMSVLKTEVMKATMAGCELLGLYMDGNSSGVILPYLAEEKEVHMLKQLGYNIYISQDKNNAIGNNLAVNDKGGIVNPDIPANEIKNMQDVLGVELVPMTVMGYETVGTVCKVTNKGFIVHNDADDDCLAKLEKIFGVKGINATVNMGSPLVRLGVVANDKGIVMGENTSGVEVQRVSEGLDIM